MAECYGQILRTPELNSIWSTVNAILWIFPRGYCPQICRARRPAPLLALPFNPRGCSRQLGRPTSKCTSGSHLDILVDANHALLRSYTVQAFETHSSLMNICDLQQTLVSDRGLLNPQFISLTRTLYKWNTAMAFLANFLGASRPHLGTRFDGQVSSLSFSLYYSNMHRLSTKMALQGIDCIVTFAHIRCSTLSYMHLKPPFQSFTRTLVSAQIYGYIF